MPERIAYTTSPPGKTGRYIRGREKVCQAMQARRARREFVRIVYHFIVSLKKTIPCSRLQFFSEKQKQFYY
jgi:hypothetical protein